MYVSYTITVISAWCYGYSKCSEINLYIKERMNCSEQRLSKRYQVETVTYVFTDIPFFDSHSPYFFKKWLKLFVPTCQLAFTRNTLNFTSHIYFHLDDSARWKQYQSVSQEMIKQISDLETVKPQEIPIQVCVIFYNRNLLSRLWRKISFLAII